MDESYAELERRVRALEELIQPKIRYARNPFSDISWRYFEFLVKRPNGASREQFMIAIYGHLPDADQPSHVRTIDMNIRRLRLRLAPHRIHIDTVPGFGYKIRQGDLRNARLLLQGGDVDGVQLPNGNVLQFGEVDPDDISSWTHAHGFPSP